jgi:hypothetical protein
MCVASPVNIEVREMLESILPLFSLVQRLWGSSSRNASCDCWKYHVQAIRETFLISEAVSPFILAEAFDNGRKEIRAAYSITLWSLHSSNAI